MVRVSMVEPVGKWSLIPGSDLDTSKAPAGVTGQLSFTGRDTAINQENCLTEQHASYPGNRRHYFPKLISQFVRPECNKWDVYVLPGLDVPQGDCYGSYFLSLDQWAECSMTVHQTFAQPPLFFLYDDMAHTRPQAVSIFKTAQNTETD